MNIISTAVYYSGEVKAIPRTEPELKRETAPVRQYDIVYRDNFSIIKIQ